MKKIIIPIIGATFLTGLVGCNSQSLNDNNKNDGIKHVRVSENTLNETNIVNMRNDDIRKPDGAIRGHLSNVNGDKYNRNIYYNSGKDFNYHGQMNNTVNYRPTKSYGQMQDRVGVQQISKRVQRLDDVQDVRTIIDGNRIYISVQSNVPDQDRLKQRIADVTRPLAKNKIITVFVNEDNVQHFQDLDHRVENGGKNDTNTINRK